VRGREGLAAMRAHGVGGGGGAGRTCPGGLCGWTRRRTRPAPSCRPLWPPSRLPRGPGRGLAGRPRRPTPPGTAAWGPLGCLQAAAGRGRGVRRRGSGQAGEAGCWLPGGLLSRVGGSGAAGRTTRGGAVWSARSAQAAPPHAPLIHPRAGCDGAGASEAGGGAVRLTWRRQGWPGPAGRQDLAVGAHIRLRDLHRGPARRWRGGRADARGLLARCEGGGGGTPARGTRPAPRSASPRPCSRCASQRGWVNGWVSRVLAGISPRRWSA
jgi:hypothetical protein